MRSRLTLMLFSLSVPFMMGFGGSGGNLVLIQKVDQQSFINLNDLDIKPVLKGENWLLASAPSREIHFIKQLGFDVRVVDDTPWSEQYYLVSGPRGSYPAGIPPSYKEIARLPEGVIVEGYDENIEDFYAYDLTFAKIHDHEIPIVEKSHGSVREPPEGWYGPENYVVDQVSDSTITDWCYRLEAFRTRYSCTDSLTASSWWIVDKFHEFGYTDVSLDTFPFPPFSCSEQWNVVCIKPGTILPDRVIVVGGHYDSVTNDPGCDPDTLAPGIDDNGSGTVVTMEAARILANVDTDVTIMFVTFAAEEQGLYGSYHAAEKAYNLGTDILLMVNMDMIANSDSYWDAVIYTGDASNSFAAVFSAMATNYTNLIPFIRYGPGAGSDHFPFHQYGFDYVYLMERDFSPHYHDCDDTVNNINLPYIADMARMAIASILYIANTPSVPTGLNATNVGDGTSLYLSWDPNCETDLNGYNIYYGIESGVYDSTKVIASTAIDDTLKNITEGTTLYITITAFDWDGFESMYAEEVVITANATPKPPAGLTSRSLANAIVLDWERNLGELDIAGYNIYRDVVGGYPGSDPLAYVPDPLTIFTDKTAEPHVLYSYYVTAVDTQIPPNESDPSSPARGRLATHDMGILIVDNSRDGTGTPFMPTDEEVDTFYDTALSDYKVQAHWDVSDSTTVSRAIMDYDVGMYSTVVWHGDVRLGSPMAPDTTVMRMFLETGGNLWLSGWMLMSSLSGESGPDYVFGSGDFVSSYVGVDSARTTSNGLVDFIGARGVEPDFPSVVIDPSKVPLGGLFLMDILLEPLDSSYELYTYVSSDSVDSPEHGKAVGLSSSSTAYGLVMTDFPLFFLESGSAGALAGAVMDMFEEVAGISDDEVTRVPLAYALSQNYPNPFNPTTTISFDIPEVNGTKQHVSLTIYNLRGRHVRTLINSELEHGNHMVVWDGRNDSGEAVSSGIYFYRLKNPRWNSTRKMIMKR